VYRENVRPTKEPTRITYESKWVRPRFLFAGIAVLAVGLGMLGGIHATHLGCTRTGDDPGSCRVRRWSFVDPIDREIPAKDIARFDVRIVKGNKGGSHAELRLYLTTEGGGGVVDLERGLWGRVSPSDAETMRAEYLAFTTRKTASLDLWTSRGPLSNILTTLFSIGFIAMGIAFLREQLGQLRPIRIVVDHTREIVTFRRLEIPFEEIESVIVESGRALKWSSKKNEHVPGFRLVVLRATGVALPVTQGFRAGPRQAHELARKQILGAMGRPLDDESPKRKRRR
jgi:hypothetical protein